VQRAARQLAECRNRREPAQLISVGWRPAHIAITVQRKSRVTGPNVVVLRPIYFRFRQFGDIRRNPPRLIAIDR